MRFIFYFFKKREVSSRTYTQSSEITPDKNMGPNKESEGQATEMSTMESDPPTINDISIITGEHMELTDTLKKDDKAFICEREIEVIPNQPQLVSSQHVPLPITQSIEVQKEDQPNNSYLTPLQCPSMDEETITDTEKAKEAAGIIETNDHSDVMDPPPIKVPEGKDIMGMLHVSIRSEMDSPI